MLAKGGEEVYQGYKEFIRQGGEPEQYEAILNQEVLPLAKELNNLGKQAQDEIKQELTKYYGLDDEQAAKVAKTVLLTRESEKNISGSTSVNDSESCTDCLHLEITKSAPLGSQVLLSNASTYKITLDNGKDIYFETGGNLAIGIFNKSADVSYKITEAIQKTGIDSQTAGLALSLAFGGPIGLAKDLIKDVIYGQEVAALEDAAKNQVTAIVRESDRDAVSQLTSNGLNNSTDPFTQQAIDEVQKTKDGVEFLSSIIFGGVGGFAAGKVIKGSSDNSKEDSKLNDEITALEKIKNNNKGPDLTNKAPDTVINQQATNRVDHVTAPIDFDGHILNTEINSRGKLSGGHSIANGKVTVISSGTPNVLGVYEAKISTPDPKNPNKMLTKNSTMFPDSWTADRIKVEVDSAFKNKEIYTNERGQQMWRGKTPQV